MTAPMRPSGRVWLIPLLLNRSLPTPAAAFDSSHGYDPAPWRFVINKLGLRKLANHRHAPLWQQVVDQLAAAILTGRVEPGEKLPSQHELASLFRVSRAPIKMAMQALIRDGLVETVPGGGSFAATPPSRQGSPADAIADRLADAYAGAKSGRSVAARDYAFVRAAAIADCMAIVSGRDQAWWLNRCETLYRAGETLTGPLLTGKPPSWPECLNTLPSADAARAQSTLAPGSTTWPPSATGPPFSRNGTRAR